MELGKLVAAWFKQQEVVTVNRLCDFEHTHQGYLSGGTARNVFATHNMSDPGPVIIYNDSKVIGCGAVTSSNHRITQCKTRVLREVFF